jgi:solute:Na+ symporter, SSS family
VGLARVSALDWTILAATLLLATGVGLFVGKRAGTARAYIAGDHDIPGWVVLISIVATETSSVTFLSVPGVSFFGDLRFLQLPLGYVVGRVVVARLLLPRYFEGDSLTAYEVLGRRFGAGVKRLTSLLFIVTRSVCDGLRLYLTALLLHELLHLPLAAAIAVIAAATIAYTFVGGVKAVVWTDVVQFALYLGGGALALAVACGDAAGGDIGSGLGGVLARANDAGKLRMFDFSLALDSGSTFWVGLVGGAFLTLASHGADQMMVQRYLCARSQRQAAVAVVASGVVVFLQFGLFLLLGLALWSWFGVHPPAAAITKGDEVFSRFIATRLTAIPGAAGVILGALFAVSMSTLSSSLNASASALVNDHLRPTIGREWNDGRALLATKGAMLLFCVVQGACALVGSNYQRSVVISVLWIASITTGVTLGLFFLARVAPGASGRAAFVAALAGLAAMITIASIKPIHGAAIHGFWYSCIGSMITLGVGVAAAALLPCGRRSDAERPGQGRTGGG